MRCSCMQKNITSHFPQISLNIKGRKNNSHEPCFFISDVSSTKPCTCAHAPIRNYLYRQKKFEPIIPQHPFPHLLYSSTILKYFHTNRTTISRFSRETWIHKRKKAELRKNKKGRKKHQRYVSTEKRRNG